MSVAEWDPVTVTLNEPLAREGVPPDVDTLRWLCALPAASEDFLLAMCDRGLYLDELAHRHGPRRLLERLADEREYPEAILTIGLQFYTSVEESECDLEKFLDRHKGHKWLLETLARHKASSSKKEQAYLAAIHSSPDSEQLLRAHELRGRARRAQVTSDPVEIETLFASDEPEILRGLAANPHTPAQLLDDLSRMQNRRLAREIRLLALETLSRRSSV